MSSSHVNTTSSSMMSNVAPSPPEPPWYGRNSLLWPVAGFIALLVTVLLFGGRTTPLQTAPTDIMNRLEDPDQGAAYLAPLAVWTDRARLKDVTAMCTATGRCTLTYWNFGGVHGVQLQCAPKGCYPVGGW